MSTPWGSNLATIPPATLNANADVTTVPPTWTTAIHSQEGGLQVPLAFNGEFDVLPIMVGLLVIVIGAVPPDSLEICYAIESGTPLDSYICEPVLLVSLAKLVIPFVFNGLSASGLWKYPGHDPLIQVFTPDQPVTVKATGSFAKFILQSGVS